MDLVHLALDVALHAHMGQRDKQNQPYIFHPVAVASMFTNEDRQVVGLLHDVVEDTDITLKTLRVSFPEHLVDAVDAITHRKSESNDDYIRRCAKNLIASDVKRKDIEHNSGRLDGIGDADTIERLKKKYERSLELLNEGYEMDNEKIASEIVAGIEWDVNDRRGMHMSGFDEDIQEGIRDTWEKIILKVLACRDSK